LAGERGVTGVDVVGAVPGLGELEQPRLVEVGKAPALLAVGFELAVEAGQLGVEKLVVDGHRRGGECRFASDEDVRAQQRGSDLLEHELVERVGADGALWASLASAGGPGSVVVGAVVVVLLLPVALW